MTTMLLKNLIDNLDPKIADEKVKGISSDSRKLKKAISLFLLGNKLDGNSFIKMQFLKERKLSFIQDQLKKNIQMSF